MKQTLKLLSSSIWLLSMAGCYLGTPSTSSLDAWEKPGADFTEVAKAFLECGKPTPYDIDPENQKLSYNEKATVYACMVQAGFRDKVGGGLGVRIIKPKTCRFVVQAQSFHSAVSRGA